MTTTETRCHCGQPLHYSDPEVRAQVEAIVARFGPYIDVIVDGKTYHVPRHFIALHGLAAVHIDGQSFEEVV